MGEPRNRLVRSSPQRSQLLSALLSGGAVAAVAVAFAVAGVDDVEVAATLLFAPVFVAALLGGRSVGYAAAAAATLGYLALRYGDIGDSGALRVAVLVAARAVCYALVAQATPSLQHRFVGLAGAESLGQDPPGDRVGAGSSAGLTRRSGLDADEAELGHDQQAPQGWPHPEPAFVDDHQPVPVGAGSMGPPPAEAGWAVPHDETARDSRAEVESDWHPSEMEPAWGLAEAEPSWDPPAYDAAPSWNPPGHEVPEPWGDPVEAPAVHGRFLAPPAPTVPTGWVDDATVPLGEDTIPLGYTGELFLPRDLRQRPNPTAPVHRNGSTNGGPHPPPYDPLRAASGYDQPPDLAQTLGPAARPTDEAGGPWRGLSSFGAPPAPPGAPLPGGPVAGGPPGLALPPQPEYQQVPPTPSQYPSPHPEQPQYPPPPQYPEQPQYPARGPSETPPTRSDQAHATFEGGLAELSGASAGVDPETRLWNARFFRERLTSARDRSRQSGSPFSVVMIQVADQPFQALPYRRQVALLRELGYQFVQARIIDHLVHLPDGAQHWFAVVLPATDRSQAHLLERRLRSAIASYLRSRGLHLGEVQSASLTSPDDDEAMSSIWASLLGPTSVA